MRAKPDQMERRNNVRESSGGILFFQDVFPIIVDMDRIIVLFTSLSDGKAAVRLLLEEADPLIEFCVMNFLFCVHENLPNYIARIAQFEQFIRKYLEQLSHDSDIIIRYS